MVETPIVAGTARFASIARLASAEGAGQSVEPGICEENAIASRLVRSYLAISSSGINTGLRLF
ncbi:hypothetical protein [Oscillatoria sp. FACHB-1406]|uniref:hypothetical protein n=1 Tax=Oscillatoria sp. FACHB-1406 TaxID=2692846 RepID=UPI001687B327|nr:hypothetical protein [Oscillatoria sp. FACHB-1406]MBD2580307.1 hypothetical protein [Oscillatoria sp. FACHB-1406]